MQPLNACAAGGQGVIFGPQPRRYILGAQFPIWAKPLAGAVLSGRNHGGACGSEQLLNDLELLLIALNLCTYACHVDGCAWAASPLYSSPRRSIRRADVITKIQLE